MLVIDPLSSLLKDMLLASTTQGRGTSAGATELMSS
jgi:hypothetical protein